VAIVSSTGRVRGVSPGIARIDASVDGTVGSSTITIVPVPIATMTVNLAAASLIVGQTTQATAIARDSTGTVLTGRLVNWTSANPAIATVSGTGLVTAVSIGSTSIRATSEAVTGSAAFSVVVGNPTTITAISPVTQTDTAGTTVVSPPSVRVTDAGGTPVAGVTVTFAVASGGGAVVPATVATNATGVATLTSWTLGAVPGANTVTATVSGLTGSPVLFSATGIVGAAASIAANTVVTQSATAGTAVTTPPRVRVADAFGNPVSGVVVTFAVTAGGGTISPLTVTTNAQGLAALTSWTLGATAGTNTVTASVTGLTGSPVTFTATGTVGAATTLVANSVVTQSATVGAAVAAPPSVRVTDVNGNGVSGVSVTFTTGASSGTIVPASPATVVTNASGIATLTSWTLRATAGANTLTAAATGLSGSPVTFTANGIAGSPTTIAANSATTQSATAGTVVATPPSVRVTDVSGNPVTGVVVNFAVTVGGGTIAPASVSTNASGIATLTSWTLGVVAGTNTVTATVAGLAGSPVSFSATGTAGAATQLAVVTQPAGAVNGTAFTTQPVVEIRDVNGNRTTSTAAVTVARATGTGTLGGTLTVNAVNGTAAFAGLAITGVGAHTLSFTSTGLTAATSASFTVAAGTPTQLTITTQPAGAVSGVALTTQPVVAIRDVNGNLTTSTAAVTASIATGTGTLGGTVTVNAVNGVATFTNLRINGGGAFTLSFTSTGLTAATSASLTSTQVADSVAIQTQPGGAASGAPFATQPVVRILDNAGLVVTTGTGATLAVTASVATGTGTLGGTVTVNAVNGVATFTNLQLTGSGAHTLRFAVTTPALSTVSASFALGAGAATQLAITTQPAGAVSGVALTTQPVIAIRDASNNLTTSTAAVTAAIATGTGTLAGTVTVNAVNGVATFTNLQINGTGAHTLTFTSTGLTSATSGSVSVTQNAASLAIQTQPSGAVNGVAFTTQPVVRILDNAGLVVTTGTGATEVVTASIATGTGTLGGTVAVAAVNGVATFTNLQLTGSGAHTLRFATTTPALNIVSASISLGAGAATQLAVTTQPAGAVSGVAFTTQPVIAIRDASNNLTTSTAAVTAAISTGTGTLAGTVTVNAVNGVATFTNLQINGSGAHTLTFTSSGLTSATSGSLSVTQNAASLSIQTQPSGAASGVAFTTQPVVRILDNAGLVVTTGTGATEVVTASIATGTGALGGTVAVAAVNGVATFSNLQLTGSGAHTLQFATTTPALTVVSASIPLGAGPATQLAVTTQPAGAVSGAAFTTQPVIAIRDASNNLTTSTAAVTAAIATGTGTLAGTVTVNAVNGVATFTNLQLTGSGAHTLTFTSPGLTAATSASVTVGAGAPTQLAITTQPAGAVSGVALTTQPVIAIRDASNNLTTSTAAVTAAIATGTGTLAGTVTVNAVNGVATFTNLQINGSGAHTITFTSSGLTSATSGSVSATQNAASLSIQTQPSGAASGVAFTTQPVVRILDNAGLVVTTGTGATEVVTASIATGTGTLGGTVAVAAVNGVATFTNLQLTGSGAHTLQFATTTPALTVVSASIPLGAGSATQLAVTTQPAGAVSGVAFTTQPVIAIRDASNNLTTSTAAVTAAIATGTGTLAGTVTVNAVNGVATFTNLQINGSGAHTITFTSSGLTSATSSSLSVTQNAASLSIQTQPSGATSGVAFTTQPVVRILDNAGLVVTTGTGATEVVTASIATGTGTLGGTVAVAAVNGVATFTNLQLTGSGAHTLQFATTTPALTVISSSISLGAGAATQLAVTTQPAGAVSGVAFTTQPVIAIRDASNNLTTSTAAVTAAIATGTGTLAGTVTVNAVNGVATFTNLQINGSGAHTITFTSSGLTSATSGSVSVTQNAASLSIQTQPSGAASGVAFTTQPVVRILDNAGLVVTTGTGATEVVTASIATGTGTLGGTVAVAAVNGVATFTNLQLTGSGAHTLRFAITTPALNVVSSSIALAAGPATQLAVTTQPAGAVSGAAFTTQPVIAIRDASNNLTTSTAAVTAAIATGTGTLGGTVTVNAVNGVATFTNLQLTGSGAHTLTFTSPGLTAATSASVTVGAGAPTQLAITTQPAGAVSGVALTTQPVIAIRDASNNLTTSTAAVTAAIATGTGTLAGTVTVNAVNGVATFTNLQINGSGAHTITFTSSGLTSATSGSVSATQNAASLSIQTQPSGAASGVAFTTQPVVRILDNAGLVVTTGAGATEVVTASIATGTGTLGGTVAVAAVNGVATFTNLQLTGSGAHTLQFATTTPALTVTSSSIALGAGPATQLAVTTQPAGAVSGVAFTTQPVIAIRDASNNLTTSTAAVTAAIATGTGTLAGTVTVNAVNGVATFTNLQINGSGAHTLTFTSSGLTSATSGSVSVTQNAASLSIQTQPSGATSGVAFTTQPVVRILDNAGLVVTTGTAATATVTASIATGSGTLGGTVAVAAVNGVATFTNLQLTGSGAHTLQFATTTPALTVVSSSIALAAGPATQLAVTTQPAGAVSGVAFTTQPVIAIRDASNNLTTSTAAVTAAIATGTGTLAGTVTVNAVNGVATFTNLQINGTGAHTLTFTSSGLTSATSGSVSVTQTPASLSIQTQPSGAASGVAFTTQPVVRILDNAGLDVTTGAGATATVTASIASGSGTLGGTVAVAAVNGVATFTNLQLTGSGAHTLRFAITSPALNVVSASIALAAGPATQLAVTTQPAGAVSGVAFTTQPVVAIRDASNNLTTSTAAVTATIATGSGALVGTVTVNAVNGVATFTNLQVNGSGAHTITFTSGALTSATSTSFTVTQVAASLAIQTQPSGATNGVVFGTQPVVQVLDNAGLVVTTGSGATLAITASINTGAGTLAGSVTVNAVNGVATFASLSITGTGDHTLQFASTAPVLTVNSALFTVGAFDLAVLDPMSERRRDAAYPFLGRGGAGLRRWAQTGQAP
jgi:hypothetical protein